jgi:hypothetical protein
VTVDHRQLDPGEPAPLERVEEAEESGHHLPLVVLDEMSVVLV